MPLARLSIKSALRVAQHSVTLRYCGDHLWIAKTRYVADDLEEQTKPLPRLGAKAARRERRIFVALRVLGYSEGIAAAAALAGMTIQRDWRKVVAECVKRSKKIKVL